MSSIAPDSQSRRLPENVAEKSDTLIESVAVARRFLAGVARTVVLGNGDSRIVNETGDGRPLICVPMLKELNCLYTPQFLAFGGHRRVITYEPRTKLDAPLRVSERVTELRQVLDGLGITYADVLGWSDTGSVAYQFAKAFPTRCRSLVLLGLPDRYRFPVVLRILTHALWRLPVERLSIDWLVSRVLAHYMAGPEVRAKWIRAEIEAVRDLTRVLKWSCLPNLLEHRANDAEVSTPTLIVCGTADRVVAVEDCERLQRRMKTSRIALISRGEHLLCYVNAEIVNTAIERFLRERDAS